MKENEEFSKMNINWYPGHMAKAKKQMIQDSKLMDVVVEMLDARIPISSQNPNVKEIIGSKKKIVVLNKADLADENENRKWVEYFASQKEIAILTQSSTGKGIQEVIKKIEEVAKSDREVNQQKGRVGKAIRVLIIGIPNVGKSSFINRMANKATAEVGNRPGVTKQKQWIRVSKNIELLDTPGVLWPKLGSEKVALNLSYIGTIKDEILEKTEIAFYLLKFLKKNYAENLKKRYKIGEEEWSRINQLIDENNQTMELMQQIGTKRGAIVAGGRVEEEKVASILLEDFRTGKLGKISLERVNRREEWTN